VFPTWTSLGVYQNIRNISVGNVVLACAGLIPGFWVTFIFIDVWGRKRIQLLGFAMLTLIFLIMGTLGAIVRYPVLTDNYSGFGYDLLVQKSAGFITLYCLANFFQNFGPNTTTFVIPGELFPTRYRSTAHGIAAASGKLGAIISQIIFYRFKSENSNLFLKKVCVCWKQKFNIVFSLHANRRLEIFAFVMFTGIGSTLLIPETMGKSLEELAERRPIENRVQPFTLQETSSAC
jgi:MFS transporter, PHS family, inorganic phosphate transporter